MPVSGWIGVDLDGTLAEYHSWTGGIGKPIPKMVERVKKWLADGVKVKIFTARVGVDAGYSSESMKSDTREFAEEQRKLIEAWTKEVFGQTLEVTASKDFMMVELWDDRAVQVVMNTGETVVPYKENK